MLWHIMLTGTTAELQAGEHSVKVKAAVATLSSATPEVSADCNAKYKINVGSTQLGYGVEAEETVVCPC